MPANAAINIIKCQRPAFARERENVAQEGFDAWSTGFPGPYRLSA